MKAVVFGDKKPLQSRNCNGLIQIYPQLECRFPCWQLLPSVNFKLVTFQHPSSALKIPNMGVLVYLFDKESLTCLLYAKKLYHFPSLLEGSYG
jgi:hypothetical protein